jgi:ClpX C4-type zinc finger
MQLDLQACCLGPFELPVMRKAEKFSPKGLSYRASHMPPPTTLANARVLEYAVLGGDVTYSGHSSLFVDGKELGPVPCLAICQSFDKNDILLLQCDRDWSILGVAVQSSVAQAKKRAERIYPGVSAHWVKAEATESSAIPRTAIPHTKEPVDDLRCSFCGKRPNEVNQMIEKGRTRICDSCVGKFNRKLRKIP